MIFLLDGTNLELILHKYPFLGPGTFQFRHTAEKMHMVWNQTFTRHFPEKSLECKCLTNDTVTVLCARIGAILLVREILSRKE